MKSPERDVKAALARLREDFAAQGWNRRRPGPVVLELGAHLTLALTGIACFLVADTALVRGIALLASTAGSLGVATNTHTASHHAASPRHAVNRLLTYFGYPFFLGFSATYWSHKHLVLHHRAPNVVGVDADLDFSPWFAITRREVRQSRGLLRFYYRHLQWLVFPPLVALNGFNMQAGGIHFLMSRLVDRRRRRSEHWLDLIALLLHLVVWFALPCLWFSAPRVLGFNALRIGLLGLALFAIFAPGHFPAEAVCVSKKGRPFPPWLLQTSTTLNFRPGRLLSPFCGGLQYQIEHHLFPDVSHIYYERMSSQVMQFCHTAGLPYRCQPWLVALWRAWATLSSPKRVLTRLSDY